MNIYIAGASRELDLVSSYIDKVEASRHRINLDWTAAIRENMAKGLTDKDMSREDRKKHAEMDRDAVFHADCVWLMVPEDPKSSIGCWVEFGMAVASGATVIVSGKNASIFCELADYIFETHDEALEWLRSPE